MVKIEELNFEKLVGKRYKNWKEFCIDNDIRYDAGGKYVKSQKRKLENLCKVKWLNNREFIIKQAYEKPKKIIDTRIKYDWLNNDKKYEGKGIYYILDEFNNIYIGSTIVSFKNRYRGHIYPSNLCESSKVVCNNHVYDVLYDMSNIEDEELIRMCEYKAIDWFRENTDYNVVNVKEEFTKPKKQKYKTIKVKEGLYSKAIELLLENGIEIENNLI